MTMRKDPDAKLDFAVDWTQWLANEGDTASEFNWMVPEGLTGSDEQVDGGKAVIWLSGGEVGADYRVTCRITTASGRVNDATLEISVRDR